MARPHIEPFVDTTARFKRMNLPGFKRGMHYKMLSLDTDTGACTMTVQLDAGFKQPPGLSYTDHEILIMSGSIKLGDTVRGAGTYLYVPAGVSLPALSSSRGCRALYFYNWSEPSFEESDEDHDLGQRERLSIIDSYEGLSWTTGNKYPAVAPGCLVKILNLEPLSGAYTFLYCMTPKFRQDNISYHDCTEEAYHIFGTSWMMQFGDLPTGGYFYRPPYINHGAFASEKGILAIGRTGGELFNYFHFNPWTNPEENHERAAAVLDRRKPHLYEWVRSHDGHNHPTDFEHPHHLAHDHAHSHD